VHFGDGCVDVELRIARLEPEGRPAIDGPWRVRARYRLSLSTSEVAATREAAPVVEPTDVPGAEALREIAPRFFVRHASSSGISTVGEFARSLDLNTAELKVENGWLTLVIER
jgi:hypothetical protein